jgi:hypothetical protein
LLPSRPPNCEISGPDFLSPECGVEATVYLANSPDVAGETCGYYVKRQCREPSAGARDDVTAWKL